MSTSLDRYESNDSGEYWTVEPYACLTRIPPRWEGSHATNEDGLGAAQGLDGDGDGLHGRLRGANLRANRHADLDERNSGGHAHEPGHYSRPEKERRQGRDRREEGNRAGWRRRHRPARRAPACPGHQAGRGQRRRLHLRGRSGQVPGSERGRRLAARAWRIGESQRWRIQPDRGPRLRSGIRRRDRQRSKNGDGLGLARLQLRRAPLRDHQRRPGQQDLVGGHLRSRHRRRGRHPDRSPAGLQRLPRRLERRGRQQQPDR